MRYDSPMKIIQTMCVGVALLTLASCKNGGESGSSGSSDSSGGDWSERSLSAKTVTLGEVSFEIGLPDGMKKSEALSGEERSAWKADKSDNFAAPTITVSLTSMPSSIDEAISSAMIEADGFTVVKKEKTASGFVVSAKKGKGQIRALSWVDAGDEAIRCGASQANNDGVPNLDASLAWLEKVCTSVEPE